MTTRWLDRKPRCSTPPRALLGNSATSPLSTSKDPLIPRSAMRRPAIFFPYSARRSRGLLRPRPHHAIDLAASDSDLIPCVSDDGIGMSGITWRSGLANLRQAAQDTRRLIHHQPAARWRHQAGEQPGRWLVALKAAPPASSQQILRSTHPAHAGSSALPSQERMDCRNAWPTAASPGGPVRRASARSTAAARRAPCGAAQGGASKLRIVQGGLRRFLSPLLAALFHQFWRLPSAQGPPVTFSDGQPPRGMNFGQFLSSLTDTRGTGQRPAYHAGQVIRLRFVLAGLHVSPISRHQRSTAREQACRGDRARRRRHAACHLQAPSPTVRGARRRPPGA